MNGARVEARRWFLQAQADLDVVRTLRAGNHYAAACFHAQQAAEKALKAVLYSQGARVVFGHAVRRLVRQCEPLDPSFAPLAGNAGMLDQFCPQGTLRAYSNTLSKWLARSSRS